MRVSAASSFERRLARTLFFLERVSRSYYRENNVWLPPDFALREFAAQLWRGRSYVRHMSFTSSQAVQRFLVEKAPKHFYYSSARYDQPGVDDMDAKGWRSADIVFDIDADHIEGCEDKVVKVKTPAGEASFLKEECIKLAVLHTEVLLDIVVEELGFDKRSIKVEFSGHRGFHVTLYLHDSDERARSGQEYRRELVNYVRGVGLREETLEPWRTLHLKRGKPQPVPPMVWMAGIRGRVARVALRIAPGLRNVFAAKSARDAAMLYSSRRESLERVLEEAKRLAFPCIDEQVTVDTKRLIRAPYSLNGKTMLTVLPLELERFGSFSLADELSPFRGMGAIRVEILPIEPQATVEVLGHRIRLRGGEKPRLPAPVALYLMAKGVAVLAETG